MTKGMSLFASFMTFALLLSFPVAAAPEPPGIGSKAPDFSLTDVRTEESVNLSEVLDGSKAAAVIFIATGCPYSNAFNQVMVDLAEEYRGKGIHFIGVNSNKTEQAEGVKKHAEEHGFPFPVAKDQGNQVADAYGAIVTPEVFLLGKDGTLLYHGALGNSRQPTTNAQKANGDEFKAAADAVLAGKTVERPTTKMFGCTIKR